MQHRDYTPDAICQALGLEGFKNDTLLVRAEKSLRMLLTPSFHPEVCLTFTLNENKSTFDCRTFQMMFWRQPTPACGPQKFVETVAFNQTEFVRFSDRLYAESEKMTHEAKGWAVLDGMRAHLILRSKEMVASVDLNVGGSDLLLKYVADFIAAAYSLLPKGHCRNALATAAQYVDLSLPVDELETPPNVSNILVLGDAPAKSDLADQLNKRDQERRNH